MKNIPPPQPPKIEKRQEAYFINYKNNINDRINKKFYIFLILLLINKLCLSIFCTTQNSVHTPQNSCPVCTCLNTAIYMCVSVCTCAYVYAFLC